MPNYNFRCLGSDHHTFEKVRRASDRDDPLECPCCGSIAKRYIAGVPTVAWFEGSTRNYNERRIVCDPKE